MDESRKRVATTANAKSSSLDEDFSNDFLSSWKLPISGKDTIDFDVEPVPKSSKKFSFDNLNDFGLDGAFDKLSSFKMGMSDLDFSCPLKKKVKLNSSNGDNPAEVRKETEKDDFFSFDFNELGKFNLDAELGNEEKTTSKFTEKLDPVSSEGNKDPQRGLSGKGSDILKDNNGMEQARTQDACTPRPTHLTSISSARMDQSKVDMPLTDTHEENANEIHPSKATVNKPSQNFPRGSSPGEDPTHMISTTFPENSEEAPLMDLSKVLIPRENNDSERSVSSQSKNTSTMCPSISRRLVGQSDSQNDQNEVVGESACLNEESHGNQNFSRIAVKLLKKTSCETKKDEEGTSCPKNLFSSMQRDNKNVKPALVNETGGLSLLSKSSIMKASREHTQADARPEKPKIIQKTFCKPALHGLLTTSMNAKDHRNAKLG
ncbi:hypothetical protein GUJ93_ZPchr0001g32539 [Zizania palustris]|uniref:Uncharacterized protein n=1 Tax=Zizania palustris TaxID=103762 RepID=A0A8J5RKJ9_ZIZPA|nr:hypothetical protein GUJ93_ZPchr0001g32539 [Zizania palustris]